MAQSLVDDANLNNYSDGPTFNETIKIISNSKKIFILTNNNQQLNAGDFISLSLDNKLAARALVAKTHQDQAGIKILKIYSLKQWSLLKRDLEVKIIKGDDSNFERPQSAKTPVNSETQKPEIKTEEDLFAADSKNSSVIEDELEDFEDKTNRHIKPDNLISAWGGFYDAAEVESKGGTVRANKFGLTWAHQFSDNYFFEGLYGRAMLNNFPGDGTQTLANQFVARLKYNIKGPLFTFLMPYVGFQTYSISSPDAGKTTNAATNNEQLDAVDNLKKSGPVFGVTILRRLVPGWFVKADLGTDLMNLGFAIEF